jgi:Mg-chelatase subunit ChlD
MNPHEELEMRLTALLLGELPDDEAVALRETIAQDAELAKLHDRLKFAIELARETSSSAPEEEMAKPEELKLAPERRARLLAAFSAPKTIKLVQQRRARRRELLALAAMILGLLALAGLLMPMLDRARAKARIARTGSADLTISLFSGESVATTIAPETKYYPMQEPEVRENVSVSEQSELPPANQPALRPTVPTPLRSPPAKYRFSASERKPDPISDVPATIDREDVKSGKIAAFGGRIALPQIAADDAAPAQHANASDFFADSRLQSVNEFTWAAPSGGSGGGGAGGLSGAPARNPAGPQTGQGVQWFDQNGRNIQVLNGDAVAQNMPLGDVDRVKVLEEQIPPAPVDPATGLPANAAGTSSFAKSAFPARSMPVPLDPATGLPGSDPGKPVVAGTELGTHVAGEVAYTIIPQTNAFGLNYADSLSGAPANERSFANRVGNIVSRAAAPGNIVDYDVDGTARGWRYDASGKAETEEQKLAAKNSDFIDLNRFGSTTTARPESRSAGAAAESRRGSQIALPSESRKDLEKQVAANPASKSVEDLSDAQDNPSSLDGALARDLDDLRQEREKLTLRIIQEKVDAAIPRSGVVEIVDPAEPGAAKKPSFWGRFAGGGVERSARLKVEKDAPDVEGIGAQRAPGYDPYWVQAETERIQSKSVLSDVAAKLNLGETWKEKGGGEKLSADDTLALLKKRVSVRKDPNSSLIDIKAKGDNAEEAARIANTIAEVYRQQRRNERREKEGVAALEKEWTEQNQKIVQLEQQLARRSKEGDTAKEAPKLAASAGIPQPEIFTTENPFSTFSLNVSDVSFKLAAASLEKGALPDPATVRTEEFINAFDYRDPEPTGSAPIAFAWDRARYPFAHDRDLVRFSVKTAASGRQPGRPLNLVLLLDNSGSMERADRLRIRQECLRVLASQLQTNDRISVVAFARTPQLWVDGLPGNQGNELPQRVGGLTPQGGTNLEEAMNLAYRTALRHFLAEGVNRVVLLTDGAANLGDIAPESLKKNVEAHRRQGIALDCFGIGWEGYNDDLLEVLSRNGDGRYGFVNTPEAASSEFAGQLAGALKVAASDVKVQVEFNPRRVTAYRQLGYAKHQLKKEQFRDNTVDAAEIGAAEAGNALYVVQVNPQGEGPLGMVRVRFKVPGTSDYREHEWPVPYDGAARPLEQAPFAMRLAATAASFSEWLVSSPYAAEVAPERLLTYLSGVPESCPADPRPKKLEWMIRQAKSLAGK